MICSLLLSLWLALLVLLGGSLLLLHESLHLLDLFDKEGTDNPKHKIKANGVPTYLWLQNELICHRRGGRRFSECEWGERERVISVWGHQRGWSRPFSSSIGSWVCHLNHAGKRHAKKRAERGSRQILTWGLNDLVLVWLGGVVILASVVNSSLQHIWISFILNNNSIFSLIIYLRLVYIYHPP